MNLSMIYADVITSTPVRGATSTDVLAMANVRTGDAVTSTARETQSAGPYKFVVLSCMLQISPSRANTECFRELSFSRLECGVHDRLHI